MHPIGTHECNGKYYGTCTSEITLPKVETVSEEYQLLANAGWIVVPATGTHIFCSEKCAGSWWGNLARIMPNGKDE